MRNRNTRKVRHNGFSLVEMMAVIGILSILAAFTLPSVVNLVPSRKAQISEIESFLQMAVSRAKATQQDVYVCFADNSFPIPELRYRALSLFVGSSMAEESKFINTRELVQKEPWLLLSSDVMLGIQRDFERSRKLETLTVLDSAPQDRRDFVFRRGEQEHRATLPYLLINKVGRVEVPSFRDSEVYVALVDGYLSETGERILTSSPESQIGELLSIGVQSGKITRVRE